MAKRHGNSLKSQIYRYWWLLLLCLSFLLVPILKKTAVATPFPPPAPIANNANLGARIQRTMGLLATSTPTQRRKVRILFYGQSITQQDWWQDVAKDLKQRFPYADLIVENRAIGGFAAPILIRPSEHDLYPFYPDLLIFHVYGGDEDYEAIIANVRSRTASEILLHSDHINWLPAGNKSDNPDEVKGYEWHNTHSTKWLPELADKYGCEIAEIRAPWRRYLKDNRLQPKQLLSDSIHLNDWGNFLLAALIKPHLRYNPNSPQAASQDLVKTYRVGTDVKWQDGKLVLEFEGNRIDAIADKTFNGKAISAKIAIDGKKPSEFPELYSITRPSASLGVAWPAILQISSQKPLIIEDWKAIITEINSDATKFKFDVIGSKTGYDGSGTNDEMFVSKSGRVVIEPKNWWLQNAYEYSKKLTPKGFEITWQVKPMFVDSYIPPKIVDSSLEYPTTLAQNLSNSKHILEIIPETDSKVPIQEIRVYRPPYIPEPKPSV
ncbi:SGNH/GDSL hydrolase family protein [Lyngbya sp. CCAP 1446/10]|uniref:SGNH/GDSL hydrolase family protein n=1 Tax=Microcoleaceae TaxID=1892252 RepID=UPI00223776EF|nr:SGNH/GDSL hydrolase family protein [Lyngbya sp. CCAP 1446/10]MCW6050650.1 SGNH/GDSL hydrolase family protein [Lyngbya sp. CCAP 1446/10]